MKAMNAGDLILTSTRPEHLEDRPSFDQLVAAHQQRVIRTAYRLLGRMEDAQDAAQEVFLKLLKHQDRIEGDAQSWLYRVTVNVCNDQFRRRMTIVPAPEFEHADPAPGPDRMLEMDERKNLLTAGLAKLAERERICVVLRDVEGLTTRQVAEILGVAEVTVRSQISTARMKLAKYVRNRS